MEIQLVSTATLRPYTRNARKVPPEAVRKVSASIQEYGWRQPIVVDRENVVICGHTRLLAAQQLGLERVPVHVAVNLTPEQVRAYRLMDNRSHEETRWDDDLLKLELADLKDLDLDLELTGFGFDEIHELLESGENVSGLVDEDEVPQLPADPVTRPGDLWILGEHRILCGDATVAG